MVAAALGGTVGGTVPLTRLRLHDVLLWLVGSLRCAHAVALGQASAEWSAHRAGTAPLA